MLHSADVENSSYTDLGLNVGADAKLGITQTLNLDLTINPDFSQVDVDDQQLNLTQFNLWFPEKRNFFLENNDVFSDFGAWDVRPFYSRKIGLNDGKNIPIQYGARLTGNLTPKTRIGLLNVQTSETEDVDAQNSTVITTHHRFWKRSIVKGIGSLIQNNSNWEFSKTDYSQNVGAEVDLVSEDGETNSSVMAHMSNTPELKGQELFLSYNFIRLTQNFIGVFELNHVGTNYQTDLGLSTRQWHYNAEDDSWNRVGYNQNYIELKYIKSPKAKNVNLYTIEGFNNLFAGSNDNTFIQRSTQVASWIESSNKEGVFLVYNNTDQNLLYPINIADKDNTPVGRYVNQTGRLYYQTDNRKLLYLEGDLEYGTFYNGINYTINPRINYRIQPSFKVSLSAQYVDVKLPEAQGETTFFLGTSKVEVNFSRKLFWTTYVQYNTQQDNIGINSKVQWRFSPMSDLYVVYSDNYLDTPFAVKNRSMVIRANYWF